MLWVAWRQHRVALLVTAVFAVVVTAWILWMWAGMEEINAACHQHDCWLGMSEAYGPRLQYSYAVINLGLPVIGALVAVFWGAPLLAREYEQRTYLLAWSQDVSRTRWFGTKIGLLAVGALVVSTVVAVASWLLITAMQASDTYGMTVFRAFDAWPPLQVMYALFGLALGVAVGALVRKTVLAMGLTLIFFALVRVVPLGMTQLYAPAYSSGNSPSQQDLDLLAEFKVITLSAYIVLTVGLALLAWARVRRSTQVG